MGSEPPAPVRTHGALQKSLAEFLSKAGLLTFTEIELPGAEGDTRSDGPR